MANPDLQVRGAGHLDPEVRGGRFPQKNFSGPSALILVEKLGGAGPRASSLDPPLSVVAVVSVVFAVVQLLQLLHYTLTICLPCFTIDEIK